MRISVLGFSCSGKTTFSNWLGETTNIPVFHLDQYVWKSPWIRNESFDMMELVRKESWIIDGTYYQQHLQERIEYSDFVIYLDCNIFVRFFRMIYRHITYFFFPQGKDPISQEINIKFLLLTMKKVYLIQPKLLHFLRKECNGRKKLIYVKGRKQIKNLMRRISNEDISKLFNSN